MQIAQTIAGLEPTSGQTFRWVLLLACLAVAVHHLMRYVARLQRDASSSLVADVDYSSGFEMPDDLSFTPRRVLVLVAFLTAVVTFVWGIKQWDWYLVELAATFLALGIVAAAIAKLAPSHAAQEFCKGAAEMTTTALLIGFAKSIEVVLTDAQVIHTVVHGIAQGLEGLGTYVAAIGMFGVQCVCNLFIPSGSGQAYVTMPIMAPLSDLVGVERQTAVLAYQMGDGFTNMIVPTNALLMGMLGLGKIPYERWVRFVLPLMAKLFALGAIALSVAVAIGFD